LTASGVKRHHRLVKGADWAAGRGGAASGIGERIVRRVAGRIAGDLRSGGAGAGLGGGRFGGHGARQRLRRLRAADRASAGADIDLVQRLRVLPEFRRHLHDHVVLILRRIDRRYLALAEGVVQRIVDLADGQPEPRRSRAVDDEVALQPLLLLIEIDVGQLGQLLQCGFQLRSPLVELLGIVGQQCVLVLGVVGAGADPQVRRRPQEKLRSRYLVELGTQPAHDLLH
jgi:hypothetical protein